MLGDGGRGPAPRHADAAASGIRDPGPAEGLRNHQGIGDAPAAAGRDHPRHRQRAGGARIADSNVRRGSRRRRDRRRSRRSCGRRRVGAAGRNARVPGRDGARIPAAQRSRRAGGRAGGAARPERCGRLHQPSAPSRLQSRASRRWQAAEVPQKALPQAGRAGRRGGARGQHHIARLLRLHDLLSRFHLAHGPLRRRL